MKAIKDLADKELSALVKATVVPFGYRQYGLDIDESIVLRDCPVETLKYLLRYGLAKSMQDSCAGLAKSSEEDFKKKSPTATAEQVRAHIASELSKAMAKRLGAIREGTIADRATGPRDPLRALAFELVGAALAKKAGPVPNLVETRARLVDQMLKTRRADLEAELKAREASHAKFAIEI